MVGEGEGATSPNVVWHESEVPRDERWRTAGLHGATVWLTGLSGSGKSTIASALATDLAARRVLSYTLDGDNLRHGLNGDLGFSAEDRTENVRTRRRGRTVVRRCGHGGAGTTDQPVPGRT